MYAVPSGFGFQELVKPVPYGPGFGVRINQSLRDVIVFLGYEGGGSVGASMDCRATAFLVARDGVGYLITAKHVALDLSGDPFWLRLNRRRGGLGDRLYADQIDWLYHSDSDVDLACVQFHVPRIEGYHCAYLESATMIPENLHKESRLIGIGDDTYAVGLFRRMSGRNRNMPVVHCGNVAMLPSDELIPVQDWEKPQDKNSVRYIEGYLIETHSIPGLSGSPVFVRSAVVMPGEGGEPNLLVSRVDVSLLGMWQGAWEAPPGEVLAAETAGDRVPLRMGIVVPGSKIIEMLDSDAVKRHRDKNKKLAEASVAAVSDSALVKPLQAETPTMDENPQHREDFNSLLGAAARGKKSGDQT